VPGCLLVGPVWPGHARPHEVPPERQGTLAVPSAKACWVNPFVRGGARRTAWAVGGALAAGAAAVRQHHRTRTPRAREDPRSGRERRPGNAEKGDLSSTIEYYDETLECGTFGPTIPTIAANVAAGVEPMSRTVRTALSPLPPVNSAPRDVEGLLDGVRACHACFSPLCARREQREWGLQYVPGVAFGSPAETRADKASPSSPPCLRGVSAWTETPSHD